MKKRNPFQRVPGVLALSAVLAGMLAQACSAFAQGYKRIDLASDVPGAARYTDGNLHNAWGLVASPSGRLIVADGAMEFWQVQERVAGGQLRRWQDRRF